jgi:hypothetical protein
MVMIIIIIVSLHIVMFIKLLDPTYIFKIHKMCDLLFKNIFKTLGWNNHFVKTFQQPGGPSI